ncbi:MAG: hypothetical protein ACLRX4_14390 [Oscillospiraceae bacterium]
MKKVLSLILALAMVFALVACGEKQPASDGDASSDGDKPARGNVIMTFGTADTGGSMYPPARPSLRFGRTTSRV